MYAPLYLSQPQKLFSYFKQYEDKAYLYILLELVYITKSHPELVSAIGLCNFDSEHVGESCKHLIAETGSVGIVSNQVQVSMPHLNSASIHFRYAKLKSASSFLLWTHARCRE